MNWDDDDDTITRSGLYMRDDVNSYDDVTDFVICIDKVVCR